MTEGAAARLEGPIQRIGVVHRAGTAEIGPILERLHRWAKDHSVDVLLERPDRPEGERLDLAQHPVDLVVALGGDGTLLRAARMVGDTDTPIFGINLGRLGFLTAIPESYLEGGLHQVIEGSAYLDYRFRIRCSIECDGSPREETFHALNDVVVHTSGAARVTPLTLRVRRGGTSEEIGSFSADGVILATPTGSTAYSMSAGGPIIVPSVDCVVVTPICPHSLAVRPLVVPADDEICVGSLDPDADHQVTVDGQVASRIAPTEQVVVRREARPVALVRLPGQTFFETLRRKLNWAIRPPERA